MLKSTLILFVETEVVIAVLPAKVTVLPSDTVKSVVASSRNVKELLALLLVSTASTLEDTTFMFASNLVKVTKSLADATFEIETFLVSS